MNDFNENNQPHKINATNELYDVVMQSSIALVVDII
jgi:hypothetical protein